jgi:hypothetical protein
MDASTSNTSSNIRNICECKEDIDNFGNNVIGGSDRDDDISGVSAKRQKLDVPTSDMNASTVDVEKNCSGLTDGGDGNGWYLNPYSPYERDDDHFDEDYDDGPSDEGSDDDECSDYSDCGMDEKAALFISSAIEEHNSTVREHKKSGILVDVGSIAGKDFYVYGTVDPYYFHDPGAVQLPPCRWRMNILSVVVIVRALVSTTRALALQARSAYF